jgi:hypothetical protein
MCLAGLLHVLLLALVVVSGLQLSDARTTLLEEEQQYVKSVIANLIKVKGGQHDAQANRTTTTTRAGAGTAASVGSAGLAPSPDGTVVASPSLTPLGGGGAVVSGPPLRVQPPYFNFGQQSTCIEASQEFVLSNLVTEPDRVLEIRSVTTGSLHFHIDGFAPLKLAPNRSFGLKIRFLPFLEGFISAVVVIQTSIGNFLVRLTGEGLKNRYGVTAFTGVRVPMGIPYEPALQLYNPTDEVMLIKEIYTTPSYLELKLPDSVDKVQEVHAVSTSAAIWKVKPREMKDVLQVTFRSHTPGEEEAEWLLLADADTA